MANRLTWYEFFAGGGMARLGLGDRWTCQFANEWCPKKAAAYTNRFGGGDPKVSSELKIGDIADLTTNDLPGSPDLVWGSFPCQDLSLAGAGAGLNGARSGTFRHFWKLVQGLAAEKRAPAVVAIENVVGAITSHGGKDLAEILRKISATGYRFGPMVIDALPFVPQSRPRLFIVAVRDGLVFPAELDAEVAQTFCHPASLIEAREGLPQALKARWIWWNVAAPAARRETLTSLVEDEPAGVQWHSAEQTRKLLDMMSERNRQKVREAQALRSPIVGTIYRRMRPGGDGHKAQRAEVRFDDVSGCLRTPGGGSSRQILLLVDGGSIRSRLLAPSEAARLMGVPADYPIPSNYNEAYHLFGDGLVVPVVRHLEEHLIWPLASRSLAIEAA
jgi:DNA (cytosine-5)-methyltransferase 1